MAAETALDKHTGRKAGLAIVALAALFALSSCDARDEKASSEPPLGGTTPPPTTVVDNHVTGSVGDGPIVGARLRIRANNGALLMETESSATADYDINIKTQGRNYAITIHADRGIDLVTNAPPDFALLSAIVGPNTRTITNLTPYTTLTFGAAQRNGGISNSTVAAAREAVLSRYGFGLDRNLIPDPTATPITEDNVHLIVKTSETLGEMIRRTRDAMNASGANTDGDAVVGALTADLTDGWIDGRGASGHDPRVSAVANVAAAAVLVEAMANRLHVYGVDATQAMDSAIQLVRPNTPASHNTANVAVPADALLQAIRGLVAAQQVSDDPRILETIEILQDTAPGALPASIHARLPAGIHAVLRQATLDAAYADTIRVDAINAVARQSDPPPEEPPPEEPPPEEPPPEEPPPGDPAPPPNNPPIISGTPDSQAVADTQWSFQPTASDPDGDALTFSVSNKPAWLSFSETAGRLWGTPGSSHVGTHVHIVISVSDGVDSASLDPFSITVSEPPPSGQATVRWDAPTEREDGTPLPGVSQYTIYYGQDASRLDQVVTLGGEVTSHKLEQLAKGTWYFAVTATCLDGVESDQSTTASKTIS